MIQINVVYINEICVLCYVHTFWGSSDSTVTRLRAATRPVFDSRQGQRRDFFTFSHHV